MYQNKMKQCKRSNQLTVSYCADFSLSVCLDFGQHVFISYFYHSSPSKYMLIRIHTTCLWLQTEGSCCTGPAPSRQYNFCLFPFVVTSLWLAQLSESDESSDVTGQGWIYWSPRSSIYFPSVPALWHSNSRCYFGDIYMVHAIKTCRFVLVIAVLWTALHKVVVFGLMWNDWNESKETVKRWERCKNKRYKLDKLWFLREAGKMQLENTERETRVKCGSYSADVHTTSQSYYQLSASQKKKHYPISLKIEVLPRPVFWYSNALPCAGCLY